MLCLRRHGVTESSPFESSTIDYPMMAWQEQIPHTISSIWAERERAESREPLTTVELIGTRCMIWVRSFARLLAISRRTLTLIWLYNSPLSLLSIIIALIRARELTAHYPHTRAYSIHALVHDLLISPYLSCSGDLLSLFNLSRSSSSNSSRIENRIISVHFEEHPSPFIHSRL